MSVTSKYRIYSVKRPSWNKHPPPPITLPPPPQKKKKWTRRVLFMNSLMPSASHRMTWPFADVTL